VKADLDRRSVTLGVGDLCDFALGPRSSPGSGGGLWRAQLGSHWHRALREQVLSEGRRAEFEVVVEGELARGGWLVSLSGRIDQVILGDSGALLREVKTVMRPLPVPEDVLRSEHPEYFAQLAAYVALRGSGEAAELVFVEADTGLSQAVALRPADMDHLEARLACLVEFLELRLRSRERLRTLRFRPAFSEDRPGQAQARVDLRSALLEGQHAVLLEAPTGFGKTGVILECALEGLRGGHFERLVYVTSKSTGQLQVVSTLEAMSRPSPDAPPGVSVWHVRNKAEHCVNAVFQCVREACAYLDGAPERWPRSGLARFYQVEGHARDLASVRAAGMMERICPYEVTRAALPFCEVWIGDYNYVFAPSSQGFFSERPGYDPARTLLVVDEAHNLASRAADAHSHAFSAADAALAADELRGARASSRLLAAWDTWALSLAGLSRCPRLDPDSRELALGHVDAVSEALSSEPVDYALLGPAASAALWALPSLAQELAAHDLPRLWWSPENGRLAVTCLDASEALRQTLGSFGGVVLATATPGPVGAFAQACGLDQVTHVVAPTPWRDGAYEVAVDLRVDTTFQHRHLHFDLTAATIARLHEQARGPIAVFFPSYAYAQEIADRVGPAAAIPPRRADLAAQAAWIEAGVAGGRALFLVLGSGFSEGIDLLGGRVSRAVVVGPALPEVNAVQRAKLAELEAVLGREEAFERVYRIPGMQKVNQALGRLVRAPGQRARVLLHCHRFAEPGYERLLAPEYRPSVRVRGDRDLDGWFS
jgi:DNA excision repair protein ERCC-2